MRGSEGHLRPLGVPLLFAALVLTGLELASLRGFRVNLSPSMPIGVWRLVPGEALYRGQAVAVCPPLDAPFLPRGECPGGMVPFVKRLAGVPGDSVSVSPEGVSINGAPVLPHSVPLTHNHRGEPLPRRLGRWLICGYWLYGESSPWSFDSRYFGEVPHASIRGVVKPVLVTQMSRRYPLNSSHWACTHL